MAKISIVRRNREKQNGEAQLYAVFYVNRQKVMMPTKVYVRSEDWDEKGQRVKGVTAEARDANLILAGVVARITNVFVKARLVDEDLTKASFMRKYEKPQGFRSFPEWMDWWYKQEYKVLSYNTLRSHQTVMKKVKDFRDDMTFDELTPEMLKMFMQYLRLHGASEATMYKNLGILKVFVMAAERYGYIRENPFKYVKVRKPKAKIVFLTEEELGRLVRLYKGETVVAAAQPPHAEKKDAVRNGAEKNGAGARAAVTQPQTEQGTEWTRRTPAGLLRDEAAGRWRDEAAGRWRDGTAGRWRDGTAGRWRAGHGEPGTEAVSDEHRRVIRFFLWMAFTGMHVGDAKRLRIEQVWDGVIHYERMKTRAKVEVPMSRPALELFNYYKGKRKEGLLFHALHGKMAYVRDWELPTEQVFNRELKRICREVGIHKAVSCKAARHTFATIYYRHTHDLIGLRDMLGHSSINITMVYAHAVDEQMAEGVKAFDELF